MLAPPRTHGRLESKLEERNRGSREHEAFLSVAPSRATAGTKRSDPSAFGGPVHYRADLLMTRAQARVLPATDRVHVLVTTWIKLGQRRIGNRHCPKCQDCTSRLKLVGVSTKHWKRSLSSCCHGGSSSTIMASTPRCAIRPTAPARIRPASWAAFSGPVT